MVKVRAFETFAGYGSQSITLEELGIPHKVVGISEIDPYAIKAYYANHSRDIPNFGDITKIVPSELPDMDLFTYSFPCQDVSSAGLGKGAEKGSETRSGLLWYCEDIIRAKMPKYLLMENVKGLVGKNHKKDFDKWLEVLSEIGYKTEWKVVNCCDCELPQNRERVFAVSYRNDVEWDFEFPEKLPLTTRLGDYLTKVSIESKRVFKGEKYDRAISDILIEGKWKDTAPKINVVANTGNTGHGNFNVFSPNGISRCLAARDYKDAMRVFDTSLEGDAVIRKTTPRENLRLMGLDDKRIDNILAEVSDTQAYKMAGNSIPTNMLKGIFTNMFKNLI